MTHKKLSFSHKLAPFAIALSLSGCALFQGAPGSVAQEVPVFDEAYSASAEKTAAEIATLVFVRPKGDSKLPLNVYINGRFLSSLLPGGYVEHKHCAGTVQVAVVFDDARIRHTGHAGHESALELESGKAYHFEVDGSEQSRYGTARSVRPDVLASGGSRRQAHALSRVRACGTPPPVASASPAPAVVAAPLAVAVAKPADGASERVRSRLEQWRAAWAEGDSATYISLYAPEFRGTLKSRKAWEQQRRQRLGAKIQELTVTDVAYTEQGDKVTTTFKQGYRAAGYRDDGNKKLVWKRNADNWQIVEETFVPAAK